MLNSIPEWKDYEENDYAEVLNEYYAWRSHGRADIDCLIWWLRIIVRLLLFLISREQH